MLRQFICLQNEVTTSFPLFLNLGLKVIYRTFILYNVITAWKQCVSNESLNKQSYKHKIFWGTEISIGGYKAIGWNWEFRNTLLKKKYKDQFIRKYKMEEEKMPLIIFKN